MMRCFCTSTLMCSVGMRCRATRTTRRSLRLSALFQASLQECCGTCTIARPLARPPAAGARLLRGCCRSCPADGRQLPHADDLQLPLARQSVSEQAGWPSTRARRRPPAAMAAKAALRSPGAAATGDEACWRDSETGQGQGHRLQLEASFPLLPSLPSPLVASDTLRATLRQQHSPASSD